MAAAFDKDLRECGGAVLEHVYARVGTYTARVRVTEAQQSDGGHFDEIIVTTDVNVTVRRRTLAQVSVNASFSGCLNQRSVGPISSTQPNPSQPIAK